MTPCRCCRAAAFQESLLLLRLQILDSKVDLQACLLAWFEPCGEPEPPVDEEEEEGDTGRLTSRQLEGSENPV